MVRKITRGGCGPTRAIATPAAPGEPLDEFRTRVDEVVQRFRSAPVTPQRFVELENTLHSTAAETCRQVLAREANRLEPDDKRALPGKGRLRKETYRINEKTQARMATRFGAITLRSFYYLNDEDGEPGLHPLRVRLGIGTGPATPALLEQLARTSVDHTQSEVRACLRREHNLVWSNTRLRTALAGFRQALAPFRAELQKTQLLTWLQQAERSLGRHRPVLAVGRDGIMIPLRAGGYQEASTATVSVYDRRRRRRLGTIYLGQMPEARQATLSRELTALLTATLTAWHGPVPRLAYITDKGSAPDDYYRRVLKQMKHPRRAALDLGMGARLLSCLPLHRQDGRRVVRPGDASRSAVVCQDAALAARASARSGPGVAFGPATLGSPHHDQGTAGGVLESVSLPASSSPLHGLPGLSATWPADRQRRDGGGLQDRVHSAVQTIRHALASRHQPDNRGFAGDLSERQLGRRGRRPIDRPRVTGTRATGSPQAAARV